MGDFSVLLEASIYLVLLYFLLYNHAQTKVALLSWAVFYLLILTGIKAGAKTLVILGGNAWEINNIRYGIDVFLVIVGLGIVLFRNYIFLQNE